MEDREVEEERSGEAEVEDEKVRRRECGGLDERVGEWCVAVLSLAE